MTEYRIALPWNTPPLTANQRMHWAPKAKLTKSVRDSAHRLARRLRIPACEHVTVELHYRPRDRRRRDADNLFPTLKAICDGLVDAKVAADDTPDLMTKLMPRIHPPDREQGPGMWLTITPKEPAA